jgi:hypothetical protein
MRLLYNYLDTDVVIDNDVFYFNPNSDDDDMPSFWLKPQDFQIAWYKDNPDRGASANIDSDADTAFYILDKVRRYGDDSGRESKKS